MIDPSRFAKWVSEEAIAAFGAAEPGPPLTADLADLRAHYDTFNRRMLDIALTAFPVEALETDCGGVTTHLVTPIGGPRCDKVLLCLHGGAFMWGAGAGALLEAVPLAAELSCEVMAIDYRLAPEHPFPAAVEDTLTVYQQVLLRRASSQIGIYGCSAGGMLTAQVISRLLSDGFPVPGAISMLHGTGIDFEGDLASTAAQFSGQPATDAPTASQLPYFSTADLNDPLVMPGLHPKVLKQFPPSLLVTSTRDFAASACSVMHRRLLAAGVDAGLVLFDGLWHAHHMAVDLPESRETFRIMARFFNEHLS